MNADEELDKLSYFEGILLPDGHLTIEDEKLLKKYSKDKTVVELGTFRGRAAILISHFAKIITTIDLYPDSRLTLYPELTFEYMKNNLNKYKNIKVIKGEASQSAKLFDDNSIDMIFVDAGHGYNDVMNDYNSWYSKLKKDGIYIFHDFKYMRGLDKACDVQTPVNDILKTGKLKMLEIAGWCLVAQKV